MWHGTAKQLTRARVSPKNDVEYTLCMMRQLLNVPPDMLNRWFEKNCMWKLMNSDAEDDVDAIQEEAKQILAKVSERWEDYHDLCQAALYEMFPEYLKDVIKKPKSDRARRGGSVIEFTD
jgi:hypothetical protein